MVIIAILIPSKLVSKKNRRLFLCETAFCLVLLKELIIQV